MPFILTLLTPRLAIFFIWIARPDMFNPQFSGDRLWPIIGILFLPFTTLMYMILGNQILDLKVSDWMWLLLAFLCDVMNYAGAGFYYHERTSAKWRTSDMQPM